MVPFGTLFNVVTVILGSSLGLFFKKIISPELNKKIFFVMGLFTIVLGLSMAIETTSFILMFLSIVFGTLIGEDWNLDCAIQRLTENIKRRINIKDDNFSDGLVTAFLLFSRTALLETQTFPLFLSILVAITLTGVLIK